MGSDKMWYAVVVVPVRMLLACFFTILATLASFPCFGQASVTLAWNPTQTTEVVGYNLYYGTASATYTNLISAGNSTNATVSGLVPGTTYYFAATTYNSLGLESAYSTEVSYTVPGGSTNQTPTLTPLPDLTVLENAGPQTVSLSGISSGSTNEVQNLTVVATSSNPSLIANPTISYISPNTTGTLTFTSAAFASGTANITVTVNDGGAGNNVVSRSFAVTVTPVNQPPTLNAIPYVALLENAGLQTINLSGISSGASNETQTLTVTATSSNPSLISNPTVAYTSPNTTGTLTFAPTALASGTANITVTVNDEGATNNIGSRAFTVTVTPVNQPPTLNAIPNVALLENAGLQTISLSGISSGASNETQTLTVTATSSNPSLVPNPTVGYISPSATGTLTFAPTALASGTANITVTVNDVGASNNIVSRSFTVTVTPVNQPPTLNALSNVALLENAGLQTINLSGISSGASNETQTLTVTAISSNPGLIPSLTINYTSPNTTGTVTFAPAAFSYGTANISVTVNDGGASNNIVSQSFSVTVAPVNQPPTLNSLPDLAILQNAGLQTVNLTGVSSGASNEVQTLTITASSSNPNLIPNPSVTYTSPEVIGELTFAPVPSGFGAATLTVTVNDGDASNNVVSRSFTVTVDQPPTISSIPDQTIAVDTPSVVSFTITDAETPASNLILSVGTSNPALIPLTNVVLGGNGTNRTITLSPVSGQTGTSQLMISVSDGIASAGSTFNLTVEARPQAPVNLRVRTN